MKEIPLKLEGINDNIFAGFGPRLASILLDAIIIMPLIFIIQYINSSSKYMFFYTLIPNLLLGLLYNIYLPKKHGGTPGKLIMGMQILNLNGKSIGWKEAFLRHVIILLLTLFSSILMIDDNFFKGTVIYWHILMNGELKEVKEVNVDYDLIGKGFFLGFDTFIRASESEIDRIYDAVLRFPNNVLIGGDLARSSRYLAYGGGPGLKYVSETVVKKVREISGEDLLNKVLVENPKRWLNSGI